MERTKWTDDLIDERMGSIDDKLDRILQETQTLRSELHQEIGGVRANVCALLERRARLRSDRQDERTKCAGQENATHQGLLHF